MYKKIMHHHIVILVALKKLKAIRFHCNDNLKFTEAGGKFIMAWKKKELDKQNVEVRSFIVAVK